MGKLNVLLVGGGGREYAIAWKISQSQLLGEFYSINSSDHIDKNYAKRIDIDYSEFDKILNFCLDSQIDLVVIGPEKPIELGLSDFLTANNINVFAPSKKAAQIESSKNFTKKICDEEGIPTARYRFFNNFDDANNFINSKDVFRYPFVIKYDGLADGMGVKIVHSHEDAAEYLHELHSQKLQNFEVIIEEFLVGRELSAFFLTDGDDVRYFCCGQDHKRSHDNDEGENTGGMGVISGDFLIDEKLQNKILNRIILPTINNLKKHNILYKGVIFAGLMIDKNDDPFLLEFNARFGDPETEAMCMRLESDLLDILYKVATNNLKNTHIAINHKPSICVILASNGYPAEYKKMKLINNIPQDTEHEKIFYHGVKIVNNSCFSNGGRVLSVNIIGENVKIIRQKAYQILKKINWSDGFYRSDIGANYE